MIDKCTTTLVVAQRFFLISRQLLVIVLYLFPINTNAMNIPVNIEMIQQAGFIGTPEIVVIVVVVLLLFGGKKIPELMKGIGKGVKEFKDGISGQEEKNNSGEANSTKEKK